MLLDGLVEEERLAELFAEVEPLLFRYPAIDPSSFQAKVERALGWHTAARRRDVESGSER
jgi:hypothetical protein